MRVMLDTNVFISMIFFPSDQTRELARRLANELVTGDKDFLVLDVEMPDIVNITEFLEKF